MPSATDLTPATIKSWTARLTEEARDLDLTDADDRATFRGRVATATALVKCHTIGALARHFGHEGFLPLALSRNTTIRALADAWIERSNVRDWRHTFDARLLLDTAGIRKRSE